MWNAVQKDAEKTPFTAYSVAAFWIIFGFSLGAIGWAYPRITQAGDLKAEFVQFRSEVTYDRLRSQLDDKKKELASLNREIERVRATANVPDIYYAQQTQLTNERDKLDARIRALLRDNPKLAEQER